MKLALKHRESMPELEESKVVMESPLSDLALQNIQKLFNRLPDDPKECFAHLTEIHTAYQRVLGEKFSIVLRSLLQSPAKMDDASRKKMAMHINGVLRDAGLAIVNPVSGNAASVAASSSCFVLVDRQQNEGRQIRSGSTRLLPPLTIIKCSRQEALKNWQTRLKNNQESNQHAK